MGWHQYLRVIGNQLVLVNSLFGLQTLQIPPGLFAWSRTDEGLRLRWNEPAQGMRLEHSISVSNPVWESVPGTEGTNSTTLSLDADRIFFRLVRP
jgi:hypothetical protein